MALFYKIWSSLLSSLLGLANQTLEIELYPKTELCLVENIVAKVVGGKTSMEVLPAAGANPYLEEVSQKL